MTIWSHTCAVAVPGLSGSLSKVNAHSMHSTSILTRLTLQTGLTAAMTMRGVLVIPGAGLMAAMTMVTPMRTLALSSPPCEWAGATRRE